MSEPIRLSKRLAQLLPCSRREAELYIQGGWVRINGVVVEEPQFRVTDETIELDPDARPEPIAPATVLLHVPATADSAAVDALITPENHLADDPAGTRVLKCQLARLTPVLALQSGAEGLAVFSQDRRVLRKLTEDADRLEQEYIVEVAGTPAPGGLERLQHGLQFEGRPIPPAKVSWQSENRLRFALKAPRPGQIRDACRQVGLEVASLRRIRIGRLPMAKLPPARWRFLGPRERF